MADLLNHLIVQIRQSVGDDVNQDQSNSVRVVMDAFGDNCITGLRPVFITRNNQVDGADRNGADGRRQDLNFYLATRAQLL